MATRKSKTRSVKKRKAAPARKAKAQKRPVRKDPENLRLRAFMPGITVNDLARSVAFYEGVLRFHVSDRWIQDGKLVGVMLRAGTCEMGLSQDDWAKGRDRTKGVGVRIWCDTTQDIDALAARVRAAGHALSEGPKDQAWGTRDFSVDDPDGFHLTFSRKLKKARG